jgi:hypothetical protein
VTFGVINVPATLVAFRLFKPSYMEKFRHDVLDYAVTAGFVGASAMAFVYAFAYISSGHSLLQARSTVMLYIALFGMLCLWNIHGIRLLEPRTIRKNPRVFVIGLLLCAGTLAGPYIFSRWLEFTPPTLEQWVVILAAFAITVVVLYMAMKTRGLVNRLWALFAP